jgi:hypothetical protein
MRVLCQILSFCLVLFLLSSCSTTNQITVSTVEPSPVDFSRQIKKIGIVNSSKSSFVKSYSTRLEQLIVLEERWLAEKGTEAALTGLFDKLAKDKRFESVRILDTLEDHTTDFGSRPSNDTWKKIAAICEENGVDAIFSLASHDTETQFTLKKTKIDQLDMLRSRKRESAQEITLSTLIENGWRIYDPKRRLLIDEFTSNDEIVAKAKGVNPVEALQAIDKRRETLIAQSKNTGNVYGKRMQPTKLDVQRDYYVIGSRNFVLADDKIQNGSYHLAVQLWEEEISNPKPRLSGRACYNLAVMNEFNGNLNAAMNWALKSYNLYKQDSTLDYITTLERRQAQSDVLKEQLAHSTFEDED